MGFSEKYFEISKKKIRNFHLLSDYIPVIQNFGSKNFYFLLEEAEHVKFFRNLIYLLVLYLF